MLRQQRADPADHAGPVLVLDDEQDALGTRLEVVAVEPHDARMHAVDRRADFVALVALGRLDRDQVGEFAGVGALRLE